jgi:hypothetical protein
MFVPSLPNGPTKILPWTNFEHLSDYRLPMKIGLCLGGLLVAFQLLHAEEGEYFIDQFSGSPLPEKWTVIDGKSGVSEGADGLEMNSAKGLVALQSTGHYEKGIFRIGGLKVKAGRCWIISIGSHNGTEGLFLRADDPAGESLSLKLTSEEGETMFEKVLPALPPNSVLDFEATFSDDKIALRLKVNGVIKLDENIPREDFPASLWIRLASYANTEWSIKEIAVQALEAGKN